MTKESTLKRLFQAYGPEPGIFDDSFELNDIELLDWVGASEG